MERPVACINKQMLCATELTGITGVEVQETARTSAHLQPTLCVSSSSLVLGRSAISRPYLQRQHLGKQDSREPWVILVGFRAP